MTALTAPQTTLMANPWSLIPPLGHLDAYISAVNRMPMLTLEEEQQFARALKNENDLEAAGKLVMSTCVWWCLSRASTWAMACPMPT